jgi:thymidine phosphorylase
VPAPTTGVIDKVDAGLIGQAAVQLGAGRARATDGVDHAVGFDKLVKIGEHAHAGHPLCRIHCRDRVDFDMAQSMVLKAIHIRQHE